MLALKKAKKAKKKRKEKRIVPLKKKIKHSAEFVVTSRSRLSTGGHDGLRNGVYVGDKATMYLFDLSAASDQFLWTKMFCPLHFVNAEPQKAKNSPCSCKLM